MMRSAIVLAGSLVSTVSAAGAQIEVLVPPSSFHGVHGMDFDKDGSLYAADILGLTVHRVDIDKDTIVVMDAGARALLRINPESGRKEVLAADLPVGLQGPPPRQRSWLHNDAVIGADGTIYFNSDVESAIYRIPPR
jgi:sugar lactone lactonase YvrE